MYAQVLSLVSLLVTWCSRYWDNDSQPDVQQPHCRCLHGDPCWPSADEFAQLSSELSTPLIRPHPLAQPCYLESSLVSSSRDSYACSDVLTHWEDGYGAMQAPNFEAFMTAQDELEACFLNISLGSGRCAQGSVPVVGVEARSVADIQAAVRFAARHNLRLVVKNTGHDFLGRSAGKGSFMIWTHHLKSITMHDSFGPLGAPPEEVYEHTLTLGAGVQWDEAYAAADAAGRMIVGGISPGGSVGAAGGWLLGGGHSALSPTHGLGVDNVLEISIVTADGSHLTTNAHQHADLFWALRGGGGGTFGVVTCATYRTYPIVPVIIVLLSVSVNASQPTPAFTAAFTEFVRISPTLTDAGWGGYTQFSSSAGNADSESGLAYTLFALVPGLSWEAANATIVPYLDYVRGLAEDSVRLGNSSVGLTVGPALTAPYASFYTLYKAELPRTGQVGRNLELGSWLLPRDVLESNYKRVAETLITVPGLSLLVAGGAVSRANASSTGLNPSWRKAVVHAVSGISWDDGTPPAQIRQLREILKYKTAEVRALAPESGAYFNEASMYEPDPPKAFFGAHYGKLKTIKKAYDPTYLFLVRQGVGAESWDEELSCRRP
ncbi:FAD-binding domain-containing protein [Pilatotrama ljubarskyi]|nr:FAD-binding domain-containing protein [Pilatotrama ljubarskyi]